MLTPNGPNSTIFVSFPVKTRNAPHTRTCSLLDPGGQVAHRFQLFEQEILYTIDSRYLFPSQFSILNPNGPELYHFGIFFGFNLHSRIQKHMRLNLKNHGGMGFHGFRLLELNTPYPMDSRYVLMPFPVLTLIANGPKRHH